MNFSDIGRLLDPAPMALELGWERLEDGVLHVAIRTDMHRCSGAMFEWWFGTRPGNREYIWWHPLDHVTSEWAEGGRGTHIGALHLVEERFTSAKAERLSIQFRAPGEFFPTDALATAQNNHAVSAVICARGGAGHEAARTPDDAVIGSRMVHLCRDTAWGMVLRTHFFLGHDLPGVGLPPAKLAEIFPDAHAPELLQHCYDEFSFLARLLPSLYAAEGPEAASTPRPW